MTKERHRIRDARPEDVEPLARLWFDGWRDAHAAIVPAALARMRTLENFRDRLDADLDKVRLAVIEGQAAGFTMVKADELYQFYVSAEARGTGMAAALMRDALDRLADQGARTAWLACAIGNERAARFYEKMGWYQVGVMTSQLETPEGIFPLEVWRYEYSWGR